jgi:hypothetical protein
MFVLFTASAPSSLRHRNHIRLLFQKIFHDFAKSVKENVEV